MASSFKVVKGTNTANAMTLQFSGVRLMPVTSSSYVGSTTPDDFLFGYADCHINGTPSGAQANPYTTGRSTGGDPIDISWAVYPAGTVIDGVDMSGRPVTLTAIRYVRVYTGVQQMNGIMGESSTEITAAYRATTTGSSTRTNTPVITDPDGLDEFSTQNMGCKTFDHGEYLLKSSATHVLVNGEAVTNAAEGYSFTVSSGSMIQIITQNGNESPYITVIKG